MSFGRFRPDPCGKLPPASPRTCPRCFRHYQRPEVERVMQHRCPACLEYQRALPAEERAS
jgi:hypothetical protein